MTRSSLTGILLLLVVAVLGGCDDGGDAPSPTAPPTASASVTVTAMPTQTSTPLPTSTRTATATEPPPSATPTPTQTSTASPTSTAGHGCCGDGLTEQQWGEECDDSNSQGGDGCAANCTLERSVTLDLELSGASQTSTFLLEWQTQSRQTFRFGHRGGSRLPACYEAYSPDEIPVTQRASDISFEPTSVPGLVCVCIRAAAVKRCGPSVINRRGEDCSVGRDCTADAAVCDEGETCRWAHGERNATSGIIGCQGLGFASYERSINGDDGEEQCVRENHGGEPAGSALLFTTTAVGVIPDGGTCETDVSDPRKGPDGIPCNGDDPDETRGVVVTAPVTTATAAGRVTYGSGASIAQGRQCGSAPCLASVVGRPFSCDALEMATPATGDFALCSAVGMLDDGEIGDYVYTSCAQRR